MSVWGSVDKELRNALRHGALSTLPVLTNGSYFAYTDADQPVVKMVLVSRGKLNDATVL